MVQRAHHARDRQRDRSLVAKSNGIGKGPVDVGFLEILETSHLDGSISAVQIDKALALEQISETEEPTNMPLRLIRLQWYLRWPPKCDGNTYQERGDGSSCGDKPWTWTVRKQASRQFREVESAERLWLVAPVLSLLPVAVVHRPELGARGAVIRYLIPRFPRRAFRAEQREFNAREVVRTGKGTAVQPILDGLAGAFVDVRAAP